MTGQEEINLIFARNDIKKNWVAQRLGISPGNLDYQLNGAKSINHELYQKIKKIFKDAGILYGTPDECSELVKLTFHLTAQLGEHLKAVTQEVQRDIADGKIDKDERMRLKFVVSDTREELNRKLDEIENLLGF